jgi:aldose 1-epimerase
MITLSRKDWALALAPETGGAVAGLTVGGRDVLRPAPAGTTDVLQMGCFPLVPFANRIAHGRFCFGDRSVEIAPNMGDHPHPLHGQGWQSSWTVEAVEDHYARLGLAYSGGDWPWPYDAVQTFELSDGALTVTLTLTNRAAEPAPVGLGFHPYFPGKATAWITAQVAGVWLADPQCLPTLHMRRLPFDDWRAGLAVDRCVLIDHCHTGWDGRAVIDLPDQRLQVRMAGSPGLGWLHIFAPPSEDFFCVEPVSQRPNALNAADPSADGVRVLAPGESWSVSMRLAAEVADRL